MPPYSPFFCEKIKGIAVLDNTAKLEQEFPPASQKATTKDVINAPETSQRRQGEAALGALIWKEQHL